MKKIPSVKLPDPTMGVIRSEHPRNVGVRGLVEAYNWIMRNGEVTQRDGIVPVAVASKKVIAAGSSWTADGAANVWYATIANEPENVWINGELGTRVEGSANLLSVGTWQYSFTVGQHVLRIYYEFDPDLAIAYPVYYDPYVDSSSITGLFSYDYQGQDEDGVQGVIRDQLLAVTDSQIVCYNNDLTRAFPAVETDVDWAWHGAIGPGTTPDQEYVVSPKISIDWSNIDWDVLDEMHGGVGDIYGVGVEIAVEYFNPAGITLTVYTFDSNTTILQDDALWSKTTDSNIIWSTEYEQGYPWQITDSVEGDTGIYFIFSDTWSSWYDELNGQGQNSASSDISFHWAVYKATNKGLPGGQSIVSTDRTTRPVFRAWDYEQTTNVLVAAKDKYILAVDSKSLSDLTEEQPEVTVAGDAGVAPRARCIGIASQRVVAGNISYFDSALTCKLADEAGKLSTLGISGADGWCSVVDQFSAFPDAVVYSGTVLTGGHTYWYPADILRLADTAGEIVAIQEMGTQQVAVYKSDSIYTLTAQSGISPFAPSLRASGIQGPVGPRAVVALSDQTHLYLGRDGGIYLFSGGTPQSIGEQFRSWITREIDAESYADDSFMQYDPEKNQVHVYYPVKGSGGVVRKGMIIDVSRQPFTGWPVLWPKQVYNADEDALEDINFLCATMHWQGSQDVITSDIILPTGEAQESPTTKYQELYFGTENKPLTTPRTGIDPGRIFKTAENGNDHGVEIESMLESGISDFGDPDSQKVLLELELLFDNIADWTGESSDADNVNVSLTIYGGDSATTLTQLWQDTTISIASGQITVHPRVRARYFSYKLVVTAGVENTVKSSYDWTQNHGDIKFFGAIARYKTSGVRQN